MTRVAAVDIGTNSCRLMIADVDGDGRPATVDRRLTITRLGQGVDGSGRLAPEAVARVLTAVEGYAAAWQGAGATEVGIVATSATRDAANGTDLTDALARIAGVRPRVLTGDEEARMSFRGATGWLADRQGPIAVVDIGGGSTEVILGDTQPSAATSRQIGSVRLTERVLTDDPATPAQIAAAADVVDAELDAVEAEVDPARAAVLVGVAGTATTLAALHAGLDAYTDGAVHGRTIARDALSTLTGRLLAMPAADIAGLGPVQAGREDVLAAGALILDRLVQRFGVDGVLISERDILDGLAMELGGAG